MIPFSVHLDNIKMQVEFCDNLQQQSVVNGVINALCSTYPFLHPTYNINNNFKGLYVHAIYTGRRKVLEVKSGNYFIKDYNNKKIPIYYVSIEIAGLHQYSKSDEISHACLMRTVAYFNTYDIPFIYNGLDISVDMLCDFNHTYAFCNMKSAGKKNYYKVYELQPYLTTLYIEKYINTHNHVMKRAQLYAKDAKNEYIDYLLARFELKLQTKLFSRHPFEFGMLQEQLDKYHILYFPTLQEKDAALSLYAQHEDSIRRRDLHKLGLDRYRILPDTSEIEQFLFKLYNVYESDLNLPINSAVNEFKFN